MADVETQANLDTILLALADPTRRAILRRLMQGEARVTELAAPFSISLNSVSKHIRMLERADLDALLQPVVDDRLLCQPAELGWGTTNVVYGPFNIDGAHTSDSNREFDGWLKARDPRSGIRDHDAIVALAARIGLRLHADIAMPAHNRCLVWRR